ncbi:DUF1292 domain-containing protein [Peribacillus deserti]|uniref:DUF1292 domain-containing protein n=1 Tax=Peribacillus deserti TaxID=673318 RepID=A0A2N5M8S0_9BACI|nr:DUF1292 domain-containing protein [Peribacillus deserti]PLT30761.1 DUF1292 domain-containing protein [Peribacillus deserti]
MEQQPEIRDFVTIEDEEGIERQYAVEALFDMEDQSYALLTSGDDTILVGVEEEDGEQYITNIDDPEERDNVLAAYQIAVDAAPAENVGDVADF